ncbi:MAG: hypothetical protein ACYCWW_15830 [Deltaproteobacteria bacterium]
MSNRTFELGTSGGSWMFKQDGMLFGPVPARVLIEKLYRGEIRGDTLVAREEEDAFRELKDVSFFVIHLAKAEAKLRVERDEGALVAAERRRGRGRLAVSVGLIALAIAGAAGGAGYLMIQRQTRLQREVEDVPIVSNPPELAAASAAGRAEDEVALPTGAVATTARRTRRGSAPAPAAPARGEITQASFDKGSIISAEVRQKSSLIPCIKAELGRAPEFRGEIRFTVAVGNDGHVAKLWMDDAQFKEGPLQACFWHSMAQWHFAAYQGERATLSDSFRVGR